MSVVIGDREHFSLLGGLEQEAWRFVDEEATRAGLSAAGRGWLRYWARRVLAEHPEMIEGVPVMENGEMRGVGLQLREHFYTVIAAVAADLRAQMASADAP